MASRLKKRERSRSGIRRAPQRDWPSHRTYVRKFECLFRHLGGCDSPARCCHLSEGLDAGEQKVGTNLKVHDKNTWPGCDHHHTAAHSIGHLAYAAAHGVDLFAEIAKIQRGSPCRRAWEEDEAQWQTTE